MAAQPPLRPFHPDDIMSVLCCLIATLQMDGKPRRFSPKAGIELQQQEG